jgi:hypothetical protein
VVGIGGRGHIGTGCMHAAVQPSGEVAQQGGQRLVAGRCAAQAPLRSDPGPRRDREGLCRPRVGDPRSRCQARDGARSASTIEEQGRAESALTGAIGRLLAVTEAYPELRSEERFADLLEELGETEEKISVSCHIYNDTTLNYNDAVSTLPSNLVARLTGFTGRDYFRAEERSSHTSEVKK